MLSTVPCEIDSEVNLIYFSLLAIVPKSDVVFRFLPKGASLHRAALVSYPRCGNSFLRSILESETGVTTGSDSAPLRFLSAELLRCGYLVSMYHYHGCREC